MGDVDGMCFSFNSRTRKGCDGDANTTRWRLYRFNSRTRKGCDSQIPGFEGLPYVSIHAPVKGATKIAASPVKDE